jgi:hypothetical protein
VHATQHRRTMADTGSVNRGFARGQLHRLVRWLVGCGDRLERRLCARETRCHQRWRNANSAETKQRSARGAKRKHNGASLPHPREAAGRPPEPSSARTRDSAVAEKPPKPKTARATENRRHQNESGDVVTERTLSPPNETQDQLPRARCACDGVWTHDGRHGKRKSRTCSRSAASPG